MLTSNNSGKYLTRTYEHERESCAQNKDNFSAEDQAYYDISGQSAGMGDRERIERAMHYPSEPVDVTESKVLDMRDRPEVGH